jgi:hypothetical protein
MDDVASFVASDDQKAAQILMVVIGGPSRAPFRVGFLSTKPPVHDRTPRTKI